ncbi:AfsR/SARP family transcriptional regulator [Streptomyces platensis]|uniref:AfsR/SARP family transcriptional regulator n=1 Tax=Streptomyces platensis TaxID=58346 RepID=UPI00368F8940
MVEIQLMPRFRITHNDRTQPELPGLLRTTIVIVALERHPIPRGDLAARIWPDVPDRQRMKRLRNLLWRINQILPDTPLLTVSEGRVRLSAQADNTDFHEARDLADALVRQNLPKTEIAGSPPDRWLPLKKAVLTGESSDEAQKAHEEWNSQRLFALDSLAQVLLAADESLLAIDIAKTATKIDALHESPYRTMTAAFLQRSDNATAWRVYHEYAQFVDAELNLVPSDEYQQLVSDIKP